MRHLLRQLLQYYRDAAFAAALFLVFAVFLWSSQSINVMISSGVTARFFPTLICSVGLGLSAIEFSAAFLRGKRARRNAGSSENEADKGARNTAVKSALSVLLIVVYLVLCPPLGFVAASALYLFCQIAVLTPEWKKRWPLYALITAVVSVVCYVFFCNVFHLMLPSGILPF